MKRLPLTAVDIIIPGQRWGGRGAAHAEQIHGVFEAQGGCGIN